jgi:hypothetical protein
MKHIKDFQLNEVKYLDLVDQPITKELIKKTIIGELISDFEYTDKVFSNPKVDKLINSTVDKFFRKLQEKIEEYVDPYDTHGGSDYRQLNMFIDEIIEEK